MADSFDWNVILRLRTEGSQQARSELSALAKIVDRLEASVGNSEKAWEKNARAEANAARQAQKTSSGLQSVEKSTNSLRYANYDLATSLGAVSAALTAMGVGAVVAFAKVESGLAQVQRTTGLGDGPFDVLADQIIRLGDALPVTIDELSKMAARGGQLGVANDDIASFTETLSKFVAISDTLSADQAAESIARIGNLTGVNNWEALASSIALVGVNSAATDAQIVKTTQELAQAGAAANFTADDLIGLAAAFASLGVPPERARSVIQDLISVMNKGLAGQNKSIETTARILGTTADEVARLWQSDPARFISNFAKALNGVDNITVALSDVGLEGKRAQPVFAALAKDARNAGEGYSVLDRALQDSSRGFQEQTEVNRQFAIIADTLSASWQTFLNTLMTTAAAIGGEFAPYIKEALDLTQDLLVGIREFIESDFGGFIVGVAANIATFVAVWAALRGAIALATASGLAFKTATSFLGGGGIIKGVLGLAGAWGLYTPAVEGAARGTWNLTAAAKALGKALVIGAAIQVLIEAFTNLKGAGDFVISMFVGIAQSAVAAARIVSDFIGSIPGGGIFKDWAGGLQEAYDALGQFNTSAHSEWANFARDMGWLKDETESYNGALTDLTGTYDEGLGSLDDFNSGLEEQAKKVRTLTDYANDLASVWNRAFEIRFGAQSALDAVTKQWIDMRKAADDARRAAAGYRVEIQGLKADRSLLQYWLSIAEMYGDEKRAEQLRADLAKVNQDLADTQAKLKEEQDKQSKSTDGNTEAAINNRAALQGIITSNLQYLQALAASGASAATLKAETERLRDEFYKQGEALGYSRDDLDLYAAAFGDVTTAIDNVPKDVTVTANVDPALQALNEFVAKAAEAGSSAGTSFAEQFAKSIGQTAGSITVQADVQTVPYQQGTGRYGAKAYANGGYTGAGGKFEPAGIVHRGEYVVPKHLVNQSTGLPYADALGRLQQGAPTRTGYSGGGYVRGGGYSGPVDLTAATIQQIGMVMDKRIEIAGQLIGDTASRSYAQGTATGRY